jgi:ribosomal 30S subunit maturation factor RimM
VNRDVDPGINLAGEVQGYKCRSIRRASPEFEEASTYYYIDINNLPVVSKRHSSRLTVFLYEESLNHGHICW